MIQPVAPGSQAEQVGRLIIAAVLVVWLPSFPFGNYLLYPFTILTTWFHEMGHGLTALAMGHSFDQLEIYADGSGIALSTSDDPDSRLENVIVAAGGPLGPAIVGSGLILASSRQRYWKPVLVGLAAIIVLSALIWVRSLVGLAVLPLVAAALVALALKAKSAWQRFSLQFLGVLAALSMFQNWRYLFMHSAVVDGQLLLSDTGAIAENLFLPHWVWAIVLIVLAAVMIGASLKYALAHEDGRANFVKFRR